MANKLKDDEIKWILSLDAKGVQSELYQLSSKAKNLTADNKKLEAELKLVEKKMKESEKAMEKLAKRGDTTSLAYQRASTSFNKLSVDALNLRKQIDQNSTSIDGYNKKADLMVKNMKVEDMTMAQLQKRAKDLATQLRNTAQSTHPEVYATLSNELSSVKSRMGELNRGFTTLKGSLAVLGGNLMTKAIEQIKQWVDATVDWVGSGITMAKGAEGQIKFFKELNGSTQVMKDLKKATSGTISELELMNKTLRAKELGIPIENMATLMDYARRQAQKLGKDVTYMTDSIVDGIGRQSTLILDNLGISTKRVQAEVKETGDFTQAVLKIVNEELLKQGDYALTSADKASQASAKWEDAQLKVGQKFKWLGEVWDSVKSQMADNISELAGDTRSLTERFDDQLEKVADLETNIIPLVEQYEVLKKNTNRNAQEQADLNKIMSIISGTIPGVVSEFDKYGNILSINTGKVYEYIKAQKVYLKYINKEAIAENEAKQKKLKLEKERAEYIAQHGETHIVPGTFGYSTTWVDKSEKTLLEAKERVVKLGGELQETESLLATLSGTTLEEQLNTQTNQLKKRQEFNEKNKVELDKWIKDEKNAKDEYLQLAKQVYEQRFGTNDNFGESNSSGSGGGGVTKEQKDKQAMNKLLEDLQIKHNEKLAEINQQYLDGDIKTTAELNRKIFSQEQAYYLLRESSLKEFKDKTNNIEVKNDINTQIAQLQNDRLHKEVAFRQKLEKIIIDADPVSKEMERYKESLSAYELYGETMQSLQQKISETEAETEKKTLTQKYEAFVILEKQHQENLKSIRRTQQDKQKTEAENKFEEDFKARREEMQLELNELMQQSVSVNGFASFDAEMLVHQKRLQMINEEIEARTQAGLDITRLLALQGREESNLTKTIQKEISSRFKTYSQYSTSLGTAVGNLLSGQENAMKAFGDSLIDIFFDIISKIVETKIMEITAVAVASQAKAAAEAAALPDSVLTFGASAAARIAAVGAIIMGAAAAAKATLKGLIGKKSSSSSSSSSESGRSSGAITVKQKGFADGGYHAGYTGDGQKYDIKGIFPDGQPYHAGEYIIPQEVLRIPTISTMVRKIDAFVPSATKNNPLPQGFADGGYHSNASADLLWGDDTNNSLIDKLTKALDRMNTYGVHSNISVTDMQAQLDKLNKENLRFTKKNKR